MERLLKERFSPGQAPCPKVNLVRYADDFVITGRSKELLETEVKPLVEQFMRERGLQLSPEKTCITSIETGFDFLGQNLRKFGQTLLTQPSKKNTRVFLDKVRRVIRRCRGLSQSDLIRQLNPVVRGWCYYHRHGSAKKAFKKVDWELWHSLWRWGKHRHSSKGSRWIIQRYWHSIGDKNMFATDTGKRRSDGQPIWAKLIRPVDVSIRRHIKIRGEANAFDHRWKAYFEEREFFKKLGVRRSEAKLKSSSEPVPC